MQTCWRNALRRCVGTKEILGCTGQQPAQIAIARPRKRPKVSVLRMFGRSAQDAVFAIVILAGYVFGAKDQATVPMLDTS